MATPVNGIVFLRLHNINNSNYLQLKTCSYSAERSGNGRCGVCIATVSGNCAAVGGVLWLAVSLAKLQFFTVGLSSGKVFPSMSNMVGLDKAFYSVRMPENEATLVVLSPDFGFLRNRRLLVRIQRGVLV